MRRRRLPLVALLLATAVGTAGQAGAGSPAQPSTLPTAQVSSDAGWSWFSEPRAVHWRGLANRTYLGWVTSEGNIVAGAYDHTTKTTQTFVLMRGLPANDHNNPSVLVRPDGRITMFWSAHNGGSLYFRTTLAPEDIRRWSPVQVLPVNVPGDRRYTYSNPIILPAERNRLYLFWRAEYTHPAFSTSDDLGGRWAPARALIEVPDERPYVKYASNGRDSIAMAFTNGHPAEVDASIYFAEYRRGWLRRTDGSAITPLAQAPIRPRQADLVYPAKPGEDAWVHDVAYDAQGRPRIVFAVMKGPNDHRYWYAAWDGRRWLTNEITNAGDTISDSQPQYSGGISLDPADPRTVYLSRPGLARREIERWTTSDLGASWAAESVTTGSTQDNVRPVVPRGAEPGDGPSVIWMSGTYGSFTTFQTSAATDGVALPGLAQYTTFRAPAAATEIARGSSASIPGALVASIGFLPVADREVTLFSRQVGWRTWVRRGVLVTDAAGRVQFEDKPAADTEYRIDWPGDDAYRPSRTPVITIEVR